MREHRATLCVVLAIFFMLSSAGCAETKKETPVVTASPARVTEAPARYGISEQEARKTVDLYAETVSRWAVQDDPNHFGYDSVKSFTVGSIKCTKTTDTQYYFTVYGTFRGVDKYGSSIGSFTYEYEITVDKDDGDWHGAYSATVNKK